MKISVVSSVYANLIRSFCLTVFLATGVAAIAQSPAAAGANTGEEPPVVRATADAKSISLKRPKNSIGSLLYVQTPEGTFGQFTTISGNAQPVDAGAAGEVAYERFLGPLTMKGLDAVMKSVQGLHGGWPRGQRVTLSFSERIAPVELEAATLPSALLLDSMIRDWDIDPSYAVIGMLKPDGSIEAVGAIAGRLDGAARARIARLAVPAGNEDQVADYLLSAGITAFVGTQVFTVKHYNDAGRLSLTKLDAQTAEAVTLFGSVQRTLAAMGPARSVGLLRDARVQATLEKVLAAAPTHLSARVLLDWGTGKRTQISLGGTMDAIDRYAATLLRGFRAKNPEAIALPKDRVALEVTQLRRLRDRIDVQARPYLEALLRFGEALQKAQSPGGSSRAAQAALDTARAQTNEEWINVVRLRQSAPPQE